MARTAERLLLALLVSVVAVAADGAHAARTTYDAHGTFLIDGAKTFPVVLTLGPPVDGTTPAGVDALDEVTAAGVNVLRAGPFAVPFTEEALAEARAVNAAAAERGLHTWVNLRELARAQPGTAEEEMLRRVVSTLRDDPALAFWKGADEPQWNRWPATSLANAFCLTTGRGDSSWCDATLALDPAHLWVTIQAPRGTTADLAPYGLVTDTHGVDVYPVALRARAPDLHEVGRWTQTIASVTPNRTVWTTLQVCFSGSFDGTGLYVLPSRAQQRYMTYDAILNGARALNFFGGQLRGCHNATDAAHGWNWTFWNDVLKGLILEVGPKGDLYPALLEPGSAFPLTVDDPATQVTSRRVGNEIWVIAARHGAGTATVEIGGVPLDAVAGTVYGEARSVTVAGGSIRDTFPQWGVHVYRFRTDGGGVAPDTWVGSGPAGTVRARSATLTFGSSRGSRFECSLDGARFAPCSSPVRLARLADGTHRFRVRSVDASGRRDATPALRTWTVDATAPVPSVAALPTFARRLSLPVRWSAAETGSGVESYDVRYRAGAWNGRLGPLLAWRTATAAVGARLPVTPGSTYCFSVRARDRLGNTSGWSRESCAAALLDDAALARRGRWASKPARNAYLGTQSQTSSRGAALVARGVRAKRLALLARRCATCGTVRVFWNGALLRELSLRGARGTTSEQLTVASFRGVQAGTLEVRVTSKRKRVTVDGLGVSLR